MACTVAVEEVIEQHYAEQLSALEQDKEDDLYQSIAQFRNEELEHRDIGAEHNNHQNNYPLLSACIRQGSKLAIWLSKRV